MTKSTQQPITVLLVAMALVHSGLADDGNLDTCKTFIGDNFKTVMELRLPRTYYERIDAFATYKETALNADSGCVGLTDDQFSEVVADAVLGESDFCYQATADFYSDVYSKIVDDIKPSLKAEISLAIAGLHSEMKLLCVGPQSS